MPRLLQKGTRILIAFVILFLSHFSVLRLPAIAQGARPDWLISRTSVPSSILRNGDKLVLTNGLISRTFLLSPDAATIGLDNLSSGQSFLRAVAPEAEVELNGVKYAVGGLKGQPDGAYLLERWLTLLKPTPSAFSFDKYETGKPLARIPWKRLRPSPDLSWPPAGVSLTLWFKPPVGQLNGLRVAVHYEIYDGIPLISKWITIENKSGKTVRLNSFSSEVLRLVEGESNVDPSSEWILPNMTVVTDYSFGGMSVSSMRRAVFWDTDPEYTTQVNYDLKTPCMLRVKAPLGPDIDLQDGRVFDSMRAFELLHDDYDRERRGLAERRMYRTIAPWVTENPIMLHLTSIDPKVVHSAIDQAAECGFEMVIISFGSGFNMEDVSDANISRFREFREYANSKGIELGGYSLLASRRISEETDVINPVTGKTGGAIFGNSPCLESQWGHDYFDRVKKFISETGFNLLEHDGSYPGDVCASKLHIGHKGLADSQWLQYQRITEFYRWCRERGVYLNVPDNYFLAGSNKSGMGYREVNWSLPREQQHIHARQNLFDGTWQKTPSMGWMFVPLVQYHGGGAAATIEPLKDHLADYDQHLANNFGYGAQACYRGPRLYDSPETKAVVVKRVNWFKKYRRILESDVIHVKRADGRNLDYVLHVNPALETRGMAVIYNPDDTTLTQEVRLPLYYTGLKTVARLSLRDARPVSYRLGRDYSVTVKVTVKPHSDKWIVIR